MRRAPEYSELMSGMACSANVAWSAMPRNLAAGSHCRLLPVDHQAARPPRPDQHHPKTAEGGRWHTVRSENTLEGVMGGTSERGEVAASERWFRSLLSNISDTVSITDGEGKLLFTSGIDNHLL